MSVVGPPLGEVTSRVPSTAVTRWRNPVSPVPRVGSAPPRPSSVTVAVRRSSSVATTTWACSAPECLATLVRASLTTK